MENGPSLTKHEKLDAVNLELESWLQGLSDRTNPSRKAIIDVLCSATFSATTEDKRFDDLPQQLLAACDNSVNKRNRMLQTPFLDGQHPIAWVICNLPASLLSGPGHLDRVPWILRRLFNGWSLRKIATLKDSIEVACCIRNSDKLFEIFDHILAKDEGHDFRVKRGLCKDNTLTVEVVNFPTYMLTRGRVEVRFVSQSRLYSVGFAVSGTGDWNFFHKVEYDYAESKLDYPRRIHVDIYGAPEHLDNVPSGLTKSGTSVGRPYIMKKDVFVAILQRNVAFDSREREISASVLKIANPFIGVNRQLKCRIRLST